MRAQFGFCDPSCTWRYVQSIGNIIQGRVSIVMAPVSNPSPHPRRFAHCMDVLQAIIDGPQAYGTAIRSGCGDKVGPFGLHAPNDGM